MAEPKRWRRKTLNMKGSQAGASRMIFINPLTSSAMILASELACSPEGALGNFGGAK
jgi:hypothetical protein